MDASRDKTAAASTDSKLALSLAALLALGLCLQVFLWSRHWIYGDQYALLTPAMEYVLSGELAPVSKGMSGGGRIPGTLLQLLVGIPLRLWEDYRAPALAVGLSQVMAVTLLVSTLIAALGTRFAAFFVAVYWLSPWRLYHAGFLWEPGFVLLPAALHMGCCWLLRSGTQASGEPAVAASRLTGHSPDVRLAASLGLGVVMVATLQIHASFLVLVVATAILMGTRRIRVQPVGAAAGAVLAGLTLVPTVLALASNELPRVVPEIDRRVALPVLVVSNAGKAFAYWLRLGSADIGRRLRQTAWLSEPPPGTEPGLALPSLLVASVAVLTVASVIVAVYATWRYWRSGVPRSTAAEPSAVDAQVGWVRAYVLTVLAAVLITAAISPVPIHGWHMVIALHAACIPVATWLQEAFDQRGARRGLVVGFVALLVITTVLIGLGHPMYMRPDELHIQRQDIPEILRPLVARGR